MCIHRGYVGTVFLYSLLTTSKLRCRIEGSGFYGLGVPGRRSLSIMGVSSYSARASASGSGSRIAVSRRLDSS